MALVDADKERWRIFDGTPGTLPPDHRSRISCIHADSRMRTDGFRRSINVRSRARRGDRRRSLNNDVRALAGEEIRWVNVRRVPVSVVFNGLQHGDVSCEHGCSNSANSHMAAVILPDDTVSLCFRAASRQTYRVLDAQRSGVELNHEVTVEIIEAR